MMDIGVALEALGVFCNTEVTSFQTPGQHFTSNTTASHVTAPSLLSINHFILQVLNADAHRSTLGVPQVVGTPVCQLSVDTNVDSGGNLQLLVDKDEFFDPKFNYDFTNITDHQTFYRGGEVYERPCGWKRFALKVLGKFNDDIWLGHNLRTTQSVAGEWPVSYHGTSMSGAEGIIAGHYKAGLRERFGRGVYSTPYILEATPYITEFQSKITGKRYQVLLQNRINPWYRKKYNNDKYWLVEIPPGTSVEKERETVNMAIRPYGLLLREI